MSYGSIRTTRSYAGEFLRSRISTLRYAITHGLARRESVNAR